MLPRFEVRVRHRPIAVVGTPAVGGTVTRGESSGAAALPLPAASGAVEVALGDGDRATLSLTGPDGTALGAHLADGRVSVSIGVAGVPPVQHRSRRHGRALGAVSRFALALTGPQVTALVEDSGRWRVRARVDLTRAAPGLPFRDAEWLAGLTCAWDGDGITHWQAGGFGQLGLRDVRVVSDADGTPYRDGADVLLTATSAGPGFFDTAHTSVWALGPDNTLEHRGDLFFGRPDRAGVFGDHATHLLRDGDRWRVATSTWSTLPGDRRERRGTRVDVTLAESTDDLSRGVHVLATRALALPTVGPSVAVWDPHLVRRDDGSWLVGYVSARRYFDFHPVVSAGADLDHLRILGAATYRTATEGTTLLATDRGWRVLASDGPDGPRSSRGRYPVFDTDLTEVGALDAPYPSNIPWPTVVAPDPRAVDGPAARWRLVTFDGTPAGGRLAGYGTHGDLVVLEAAGAR